MIEVWQTQDTLRPALRLGSLSHSSGLPNRRFMIVQGACFFQKSEGTRLRPGTLPKSRFQAGSGSNQSRYPDLRLFVWRRLSQSTVGLVAFACREGLLLAEKRGAQASRRLAAMRADLDCQGVELPGGREVACGQCVIGLRFYKSETVEVQGYGQGMIVRVLLRG